MLLGLVAAAAAGVPTGMAARGDDRVDLEVREFASSPDRSILVAVTEDSVVPMAGETDGTQLGSGGIVAADVSNDGWLALAHAGGVTIHDDSGRELLRLGGYPGALSDIAFSPDRSTFAVSTAERVVVHNTADGQELWAWSGQTVSVTYHPDGKKVITGIPTGNLVLDATNGRVLNGFDTEPAIHFDWRSDRLFTHEEQGPLKTWNPVTLEPIDNGAGIAVRDAVAVHPDGSWLLVDGCVTPRGAMRPTSLCVDQGAVATAFDLDGALYVASGQIVRKWQPLDERSVTDLGLPPGGPRVTAIAAADGGDWIVVTENGVIQRLAADGTAKFTSDVPGCGEGRCEPRAIGGYQQETWVVGPDGQVLSWDGLGQPIGRAKKTKAIDVARLPDGSWVSLTNDRRVRLGSAAGKGKPSAPLPGAKQLVAGVEGFVVIGDSVHPFKADGLPRPEARLGPERSPRSVAVDQTGLAVAVLDDSGTVHRFSPDGRPVFREALDLAEDVDELAWSADGAWLVVGGSPLRVFDAASGAAYMDIILSPPGSASGLASSAFGFLGVVQGSESREEVRLVRIR